MKHDSTSLIKMEFTYDGTSLIKKSVFSYIDTHFKEQVSIERFWGHESGAKVIEIMSGKTNLSLFFDNKQQVVKMRDELNKLLEDIG